VERAPGRPRAAPRPTWEALTDPAELHRWWGDTELDLVEGGRFALRWRNTDEHGNAATLDGGEVDIAHPDRLFEPIQRAYAERYPESPTA
jgi:uncharacterized protein YndB with AHSA1/START domain